MKFSFSQRTYEFLRVLSILLIFGGVVVLYRLYGDFSFSHLNASKQISQFDSLLSFDLDTTSDVEEFVDSTSTQYRVQIPKIGVDMPIVIGETDEKKGLDGGAWLIPGTAIPGTTDPYNNVVLSAHRFKYESGKYTFFEVDKLVEGDEIVLVTPSGELRYRVAGTEVVLPNAVRILEKSDTPMLTLFTCTPTWSSAYRLVIYAYPLE